MQHPLPEFAVGTPARVIVNTRNRTLHVGHVRRIVWHFKLSRWAFYLEVAGRRVSRRYFADDLVALPPADITGSPSPQG